MAQFQFDFNQSDEYFTPKYAVYPIMKYIQPGTTIWCPFDTRDSAFVRVFGHYGFHVVYGHIQTGQDFFQIEAPKCDYIISNPPYSLKNDVLRKLYYIGKPFAMLINFQGIFGSLERFHMFKDNPVEMMWLYPRVNYIDKNGNIMKSAPFQSGYICSKICKNQLNFEFIHPFRDGSAMSITPP